MTRPPPRSTLFPYTTLFRSGLTCASSTSRCALDTARRSPHQLGHGVDVAGVGLNDPLDPAAVVDLAMHVAEHALPQRREQAFPRDPRKQLVRPAKHLPSPRLDDAAGLELDLIAEVAGGVEHVV